MALKTENINAKLDPQTHKQFYRTNRPFLTCEYEKGNERGMRGGCKIYSLTRLLAYSLTHVTHRSAVDLVA